MTTCTPTDQSSSFLYHHHHHPKKAGPMEKFLKAHEPAADVPVADGISAATAFCLD